MKRQIAEATKTMRRIHRSQITHGMSGTLTYQSWNCMMQRCFNPWNERFRDYGGAGITACRFMRSSPINVLVLIGERPSAIYTLDRVKNEGNYSCGTCEECLSKQWPMNVRWATAKQQALNRSNNRMVEIDGVIKPVGEWADLMGIGRKVVLRKFDTVENN